MTHLTLSPAARARLQAQINLNGTFNHTLTNDERVRVNAVVNVEQCSQAIRVSVMTGPSTSCITLDRTAANNGYRVARFITETANGWPCTVPAVGEHELVDDMELTLRETLSMRRGTHYLPIDDLDVSVQVFERGAGLVANLQADDVQFSCWLPQNREPAYQELCRQTARFIQALRATSAQAA